MPSGPSSHIDFTRACLEIFQKVSEGDIDAALELTEAVVPGALGANPAILFRLHCQKYAQMVRPPTTPPPFSHLPESLGQMQWQKKIEKLLCKSCQE